MSLHICRSAGEAIQISDDIKVTVTSIGGGKVKLAITAPKEVKIYREEIYLRIEAEKAAIGEYK
ncbi:carbon storage regulator CsrA [Pseudomonas aeruginosa]|jgi:carbon storage regulator|nr:carbon storage regulator CsrA [Pseudomonas aeruginosa]